ncbi:MAG: O-antigen ligase family protein, partial [bacterium]
LILASWALHASGTKSSAINERLVKLRMAAEMWRREPLLGVGLNAYKSWYPALEQQVRLKHNLTFEALGSSFTQENRTHNDHAQMLCETGFLGLGMFFWLMAALIRVGLLRCREWRTLAPDDLAHLTGLMGGVLVVLVYAMPNFPFHIVSSAGTFWIMAGLLASYAVRPSATRSPIPVEASQSIEAPARSGYPRLVTVAGAITVLLVTMFSTRLFIGTLEYKRADYFSRLVRPAQPREAAIHYQNALDLDAANAQYHYDYGAKCFNAMAADPELGKDAGRLLKEALALGFLNEDLAYGLAHIAEVGAMAAVKPGVKPPSDTALPADTPEILPLAIRALDSVAPFDLAPLANRLPKNAEAFLWFSLATRLNERHDPSRRGRMGILQREILDAEQARTARRWGKARDLYAAALKRNPANFLAAMNLGTLTVTPFGDSAGGIRSLEDAARSAVNEPNAWLALGRGYAAAARIPDARRALERAAALDPKSPEIQAALGHLRAIETGAAPAPVPPPAPPKR